MDRRSFRRNLELNAVILDQGFGDIMEDIFRKDAEKSR
jgi:phosphatidylserine/phosphatidylglycerophosphate/cardiolipin synthase-like enzyme